MDLNPDSTQKASPGVQVLLQSCSAPWKLPDACLDVIFTSNFFEHLPTKSDLRDTLLQARRCLKPGGRLIALGPNIRYLPGEYWDFYDHYLALTERSLAAVRQAVPGSGGKLKAGYRRLMARSARLILYAWVVLVACPVRYWPLKSDIDSTWRFALNYAAAHGLVTGVDTVFTTGPLAYLMFPQDIGNNLAHGLMFQAGLWLVLAAIFADIFFRAGFPVRNLALFSFCFGLSAPVFWFNGFGLENLVLAGALL